MKERLPEDMFPEEGSFIWRSSTRVTGASEYSLASSPKSNIALVFALAESSSTSREILAKKQGVRS